MRSNVFYIHWVTAVLGLQKHHGHGMAALHAAATYAGRIAWWWLHIILKGAPLRGNLRVKHTRTDPKHGSLMRPNLGGVRGRCVPCGASVL